MVGFRVTKYGPVLRVEDDWTSVSDVGKRLGGGALTLEQYLRVEAAYVETVRCFAASAHLASFRVHDREQSFRYGHLPPSLIAESQMHSLAIREGVEVAGEELDWAVRLNLREVTWCRLVGDHGCYVHFGYDYYMYLGCDIEGFAMPQLPEGICAEPFISPYNPEDVP